MTAALPICRAWFRPPTSQDAGGNGPTVAFDDLARHGDGLILLTGGPQGPVDALLADAKAEAARACLERLKQSFGDRLYVEIQRHGGRLPQEAGLIRLAFDLDLPLVATNQPYFAKPDDFEAHDALMCIAAGRLLAEDDRPRLTPDHYFKSRAEMALLFADLTEALASTVEIARRCHFRVEEGGADPAALSDRPRRHRRPVRGRSRRTARTGSLWPGRPS